jgi:hypothetical protein
MPTAPAKRPGGEEDDSSQQLQHSIHRDPNNAKRQQKQPHNGIEENRQQSDRPAEKQYDQPEEKSHFSALLLLLRKGKADGSIDGKVKAR